MECLASFVVLFVLPLALAALVVAWRGRRVARRAVDLGEQAERRVEQLHRRLVSLERAVQSPSASGEATAAAAGEEGAAASIAASSVVASSAATTSTDLGGTPPPAEGVPPRRPVAGLGTAPPAPPAPPPSAPRVSLEERLGARLPVWIGAIALTLAAGFLVKYSFDQGWIGPTVRVILGTLFGVALLGAGELLRRSADRVAQGLTAAGIAVLFVVQWAALDLYHLISPAAAFALLALTTATAVALSLRHGVMVALLGLVGGFFTPALVTTPDSDPRQLFAYLLLLEAGLLAVSRRRGWEALAGLNLLGVLGWGLTWALGSRGAVDAPWLGAFLVASVAVFLLATRGTAGWHGRSAPAWLRGTAAGGALLVTALLVDTARFSLLSWGYLAVLAAGCLVLGRLRRELEGVAWLAAVVVCLLVGDWGAGLAVEDSRRFLAVAAGALLLLAGGGWALGRGAARPVRWAVLAAASTLALDLIAFAAAERLELELPWGWTQLALAAVWTALAVTVARRRATLPEGEGVLAAAAVAATTLVSLAVPMELEREWITVAWALEALALVWLAGRLRVAALAPLAAIVGALVAARLLVNPAVVFAYPTGSHPLWSWLLYGYGVPTLAFAGAAVLARRQGRTRLGSGFGAAAVALAVVWLALSVRQAFHPGALTAEVSQVSEWGTLSAAWLALGCGLLLAARRRPLFELRWGGRAVVTLAAAQSLLAQGMGWNPWWTHVQVGETPLFNGLLLAYAAPAALLLLAVRLERSGAPPDEPLGNTPGTPLLSPEPSLVSLIVQRAWAVTVLLLVFLCVTLEVRQAFRGTLLDTGAASHAERYAYSAAWVALATVLLLAGIATRRRSLRLASLPVMLLAVGKVFLWDTAHLSDLYRVFSFLGLGISLLLLAWVYQRFVFRPAEAA